MIKNPFQVVTKTAPLRVRTTEIAMQKTTSEYLKQLVGAVGITHRGQQITAGCSTVTFEKLTLRGHDRVARFFVSMAHHRPQRGNPAQPIRNVVLTSHISLLRRDEAREWPPNSLPYP